ncbi:S-adenosylmethionine:tRNA ribosyltransferase-isomerase [Aquincola sp. S2]|uniref:S-adenosylmethionine:tRNA ribosyltransferase-isomerase n=1 Tax=Pseudaquabacterium terrae TaxID=2732868 RepID=A0ABX2EUM1_9BURK|nr:S-adenosylmethionine:tRNA ribosyltransferase-isomerase [Aquabacterium terrae]NRF72361.1 S-adenosylmethionine:tRNA ribosyltransferase-isomerase [Aquabacterium terrae]
MKPAALAVQRPADARLLTVDPQGRLEHHARHTLPALLQPGDLLVANDAATLPASLHGVHGRSGRPIEIRLAGRPTLAVDAVKEFAAVVFGEGDHRLRTEDRPLPPPLAPDDLLLLGCGDGALRAEDDERPLRARVRRLLGHPRLVLIRFEGRPEAIWRGLARHGKPVQYAHLPDPLALWDSWTRIAALPVAFEPPSAGFLLDWSMLDSLRARGIGFATLTHAAGLSSTGDAALDARLPLDEPYHLPPSTVAAIERTRRAGGRIVALGTTVTRALEHAGARGALQPGEGLADNRLGASSPLRIVDALVSGAHEPGTSHHRLLGAFAGAATLARLDAALDTGGYRAHEFGDSVLLWRSHGAEGHTADLRRLQECKTHSISASGELQTKPGADAGVAPLKPRPATVADTA